MKTCAPRRGFLARQQLLLGLGLLGLLVGQAAGQPTPAPTPALTSTPTPSGGNANPVEPSLMQLAPAGTAVVGFAAVFKSSSTGYGINGISGSITLAVPATPLSKTDVEFYQASSSSPPLFSQTVRNFVDQKGRGIKRRLGMMMKSRQIHTFKPL